MLLGSDDREDQGKSERTAAPAEDARGRRVAHDGAQRPAPLAAREDERDRGLLARIFDKKPPLASKAEGGIFAVGLTPPALDRQRGPDALSDLGELRT